MLQFVCFLLVILLLGNAAQPDFTLSIRWFRDISDLACRLNGFHSIPDAVIWRKNGDIYIPDGSRVHGNSVLHFEKIMLEDEGNWTCSLNSTMSPPHSLLVDPKITGPVHANFELHTNFVLQCNVELGPLTRQSNGYAVTWTRELIRDDRQSPIVTNSIVSSHNPSIENNTTQNIPFRNRSHILHTSDYSLTVNDFNVTTPENVSFVKYICCINVDHGRSFCGETLINISFVAPFITQGLPPITVTQLGQNVSLKVQVESFPRPNIEWIVSSSNVTLDAAASNVHGRYQPHVERQRNQRLSVSNLTISNLTVADSGLISVHAGMCEERDSSETLLIVLPSVNSVTISCTPDQETTFLTFTLPSGFPPIRTNTPGLKAQLALNFTPISPSLYQDPLSHQQILNLTYDEVLLAVIGHKNLLQLNTKRDIPEAVLLAVKEGVRFRVQAKLIMNNIESKEWSEPCNSDVFASYEECNMDEIQINLTFQSLPGTCSNLQMNSLLLAKKAETCFREQFFNCEQLFLLDPILNCDGNISEFIATLRAHKPRQVRKVLAQNLMQADLLTVVVDNEEEILVKLEMVDEPTPTTTEPTAELVRPIWKKLGIVALGLHVLGVLIVLSLCILIIIQCIYIWRVKKRKNHSSKVIVDPLKLEEGVQSSENTTQRYVEMTSFSRQPSTNPRGTASLNDGTDNLNGDPPAREETVSETSSSASELLETPTSYMRDGAEMCQREADCSTFTTDIRKAHHQRRQPRHNSDSKIESKEIGRSSVINVSPVHGITRSPSTCKTSKHPGNTLAVKGLSLAQLVSHRRTFSDPSPSREQIRQLQIEVSSENSVDQSSE